jgi:dihydroorotase
MLFLFIGKTTRTFIMHILTINRPDDWHVHLRDGELLLHTVPASAAHFARALVMPNLKPALTTISAINQYRDKIITTIPKDSTFTPYMTFYLNESINPDELERASKIPHILGAKFYPAGATTNSEEGARSITALYPLLEVMQDKDLVLQVHGEVTHGDIFDRETFFIEECLKPITQAFPKLRIILEHISTKKAVDFVSEAAPNIGATITPHHLRYNRNQLLVGGVKPHYYCLPILKHERDQRALQAAAASGNPKFFAGTDSAPHAVHLKESACGCAGIYSAPFALAFYAEQFSALNRLGRLNDFVSRFGAEFYQLPINTDQIELLQKEYTIPHSMPLGQNQVIPMGAGETIQWSIHANQ